MKVKRTAVVEDDEPVMHGYAEKDQPAARRILDSVLAGDTGRDDLPYCTCRSSGGYSFDQQLGMYVHRSDKRLCHKPTKLYYQAALAAGIVLE